MNKVLAIYKPITPTPNQLINQLRQQYPQYQNEKIGFAGRLDPMAEGLMILLIGEENKNRDQYLSLNKTYQFTALLGLQTDSYDLLGLLKTFEFINPPINYPHITAEWINETIGKHTQPYPPFSTKPVQGKQLFKWAREGRLSEIEIPTKEIEILSLHQITSSTLEIEELQQTILTRIPKIKGFFRQTEILDKWQQFFTTTAQTNFITLSFEVSCTSGTYVRSLVHNLGQKLGCGALTLEIKRTKVGNITLDDCLVLS